LKILIKILKFIVLLFPLVLLSYVILVKYNIFKELSKEQPFELISDMDRQLKVNPQEFSTTFDNGLSVRTPVDSSVPRYGTKYHLEQIEYFIAETLFTNPLPDNEFILERGKIKFETFCVPCHNYDGKGKGVIVTKANLKPGEEGFPEPADLTKESTRKMKDGRLFHILSSGQNLMFPVTDKLNEAERWAVIKYIRFLQKKN